MKCLNCNATNFESKTIRIPSDFKGETVEAIVPSYVCKKCGEAIMNDKQMDVLRQAVADAYREKYGLLTSREIVDLRKKLGMSQRAFAEYLEVGEASIKRWETYFVQDHSQNEHIRMKCDPEHLARNAFELDMKLHPDDEFRGGTAFNEERFQNAALYLLETCKSPLFLNKALFYADFLHFKRHARSITGSLYSKLDYGPCPDNFKYHFTSMLKNRLIKETTGHELVAVKDAELSLFVDSEIEVLKKIREQTKTNAKREHLYNESHKEDAFVETSFYSLISFKHAKTLRLK